MFTCPKSSRNASHFAKVKKKKKIKAQGPVTGDHKSKFLSDNCLTLLEKISILSDRPHTRSKGFSLTYGVNCLVAD